MKAVHKQGPGDREARERALGGACCYPTPAHWSLQVLLLLQPVVGTGRRRQLRDGRRHCLHCGGAAPCLHTRGTATPCSGPSLWPALVVARPQYKDGLNRTRAYTVNLCSGYLGGAAASGTCAPTLVLDTTGPQTPQQRDTLYLAGTGDAPGSPWQLLGTSGNPDFCRSECRGAVLRCQPWGVPPSCAHACMHLHGVPMR